MDNSVNFLINVTGDANRTLVVINKTANETISKFNKIGDKATKLANIGFVLQQVGSIFKSVSNTINQYTQAYEAQASAETKLAAVMKQTIDASREEIESVKRLASEQQKLGVISGGAQIGGAQELATYVGKTDSIKKLIPAINDMAAQQFGLNTSQEQYTQLATMVGKVMQGQTGALSRYGYTFTEAQEKILKFGKEEQRAAMLAKIIGESVGGVNAALAATPEGKQKQIANNFGDIDVRIGSLIVRLKSGFNPVLESLIEKVNQIIDVVEEKNIIPKITEGIEKLTNFISEHIKTIGFVIGAYLTYVATVKVMNIYNAIAAFFETALWKAIKNKTKAAWQSITSLNALTITLGAYAIVAGIAGIASRFLATGIKAIGTAIYSIPIIGWIAAAIVAIIAVIKILWDKCEGFRRLVFGVWEAIKAVFHNIGVVIKSLWENIVKPYIMFWVNLFKTVAGAIWDAVKWCFDKIAGALKAVKDFFVSAWNWIVESVKKAWDWITGLVSDIVDWLSSLLGDVWTWITDKFSAIANWLYQNVIAPIKNAFTSVWEFISGIFDKILGKLGKLFAPLKKLWNKLFPKDQFKDIGGAYAKGAEKGSESWNNSQKEKKDGLNLSGIDVLTAPTDKKTNEDFSTTIDGDTKGVASGGKSIKNINISIDRLVEKFTVQTTNMTESAAKIKELVTQAIVEGINDVNLAY